MTTKTQDTEAMTIRAAIHSLILSTSQTRYSNAFDVWDYMTAAALMLTTSEITGECEITFRLVEGSESPDRVRIVFDGAITSVLDQAEIPSGQILTVNDYTIRFTW